MAGGGSRFELDEAALSSLFAGGGMVWRHVGDLVMRVTTLAKLYAPVRTGRLRQSIVNIWYQTGPHSTSGAVGSPLDYAAWVELGTRPHTIKPKAGHSFVVMNIGGRKVYAKEVHNPGSKPHPYLRRALEEVMASQL